MAQGAIPPQVIEQLQRGEEHRQRGELGPAIACFRAALHARGSLPLGHVLLGRALRDAGQLERAVQSFSRAIALDERMAEAHNGLGLALQRTGRLREAREAFERAVKLEPERVSPRYNLAGILRQLGDAAAIDHYRAVLEREPEFAEAHAALGAALRSHADANAAIEHLRRAIALEPTRHDAHAELAAALVDEQRMDEALEALRQAVVLAPEHGPHEFQLGSCLKDVGHLADSERHLRRAVLLMPERAEGYGNLGNCLSAQGRLREAEACYRAALRLRPGDARLGSNLLLALQYRPERSPGSVVDEHRRWCVRHVGDAPPRPVRRWSDEELPGARLRVGYVSSDFRGHSVAFFLESVLRGHDREQVELFAYSDVRRPDATTQRLRGLFDHWTDANGLSDVALADRVRADEIDVLVDLAGHTAGHRLAMFALRPAALQATYLGYPATTGLDAMDVRIVDEITDPFDDEVHGSEALERIEGGFLCFSPPVEAPEPDPLPLDRRGHPTFGSFNHLAKVSPELLDVWAELLARCPEAHLLLKNPSLNCPTTRDRYRRMLEERGVARERVELCGFVANLEAHLGCYRDVDVALDTFPYNGTTTSCEALWMGVPVVTLRGDRHAGRVGASLLARLDLSELCTSSAAEYVEVAAALALDPGRLRELRRDLRSRMRASPLCDAARIAAALEAVYREALRMAPFSPPPREGASGQRLLLGGAEPPAGWTAVTLSPEPTGAKRTSRRALDRIDEGSAELIRASQVLQQVAPRELPRVLERLHRALAKGGRLLASVPDFERLCELHARADLSPEQRSWLGTRVFGDPRDEHACHRIGLTWPRLRALLHDAGFGSVQRVERLEPPDDAQDELFEGESIALGVIAHKLG